MLKINVENGIKLSDCRTKKLGEIIKSYANNPTDAKLMQISDAFYPYIKEKAEYTVRKYKKAAKKYGISVEDYIQEHYLKLWENLDEVVKTKKYCVAVLSNILNSVKLTKDDLMYTGNISLDEISPKEKKELSYEPDEQTFSQKADKVTEIAKKVLTPDEFQVLSLHSSGMNNRKIAQEMGVNDQKSKNLLRNAFDILNNKNVKQVIEDVFYEDSCTNRKLIKFEPPFFPIKKVKAIPNYNPDEVWLTVKMNWGPLDVRKELDTLLKTQTYYKELLNNKSAQTKMRKKLKIEPDFKITLKLDKKCNNYTFTKGVKDISKELFGKNIFEFTK